MKLRQLGSNQTELTIHFPGFRGETKILFSYETPVAVMNLSPEFHEHYGASIVRTQKVWSVTTQRHITKWLGGATKVANQPQEWFDGLIASRCSEVQ